MPFDPGAGGGAEDPNTTCDASTDDMEFAGSTMIPGSVRRLEADGDGVLACGDTFIARLDAMGSVTVQQSLDHPCVAVVSLGDGGVLTLLENGSMSRRDANLAETAATTLSGSPSGLAVVDGHAFAAMGPTGVVRVNPSTLETTGTFSVTALDVAASDAGLLVAAGAMGVGLLDPDSGETLSTLQTDSPALGVRTQARDVAVLRGAQGWDWVDASAGLSLVASTPTGGVVLDALVESGHVFTVEGHAVIRYDRTGDTVDRVSAELRPDHGSIDGAWLRCMGRAGTSFVVGGDRRVSELLIRAPAMTPELSIDIPNMQLFGDVGEDVEALYLIRNTGRAPLSILGIEADGPFVASIDSLENDCDGAPALAPGESAPISIQFDVAEASIVSGTLTIETNDPDQPVLDVPIEGNPAGLSVGDQAPDFTGLTLDGTPFRLSDHRGSVVFLKLFDFGCATCSEEFPVIESDLVPVYGDDVVFVGVNKGHRTSYADVLAADAALSFPVVLDIDAQAFARYRVPGKVFPLHVVVDVDGTIALIDTEPGLDTVDAALASLVGG